jgi:hypothetical protein
VKRRLRIAIGVGMVALISGSLLIARNGPSAARHALVGSNGASLVSGAPSLASASASQLGYSPTTSPSAVAAGGPSAAADGGSHVARPAGEDIPWDHWYSASGQVAESPSGGGEREYSVAPYFHARWDDTRGGLLIQGTDNGFTTGTEFICTDKTCARLTNVYVTLPLEQDGAHGSVTLGFPLSTSVPWRSLNVGEQATAVDTEGRYLLTIRRSDGPKWTIDVQPNPGGPGPTQAFDHGSLTLTTDSAGVPWASMNYSLTASAMGGTVEASWALRMLPGSSAPTVVHTASPSPTQ